MFVIFKLAWPLRRTRVTLLSAEHILLALLSPEKGSAVAAAYRCVCIVTSGTHLGLRGAWPCSSSKVLRLAVEVPAIGVVYLAVASWYFFWPGSGEAACDFSLYYIDGKRGKTGPLGKPASSLLVGYIGTFTAHHEHRSPNAADTKPFETEGICV